MVLVVFGDLCVLNASMRLLPALSGDPCCWRTRCRDYLLSYMHTPTSPSLSPCASRPTIVFLYPSRNDTPKFFHMSPHTSFPASPIHILSLSVYTQQQPSMAHADQSPLVARSRALSAHILPRGPNASPINWPMLPKAQTEYVYLCLHTSNMWVKLDTLTGVAVSWA
jgi:hypothetical protein